MSEDVKQPSDGRRRYDSTRRREQAEETRRHVIETSRPLFVEQGYVATSMRQVADAAGVSVQTVYNAFASKFGLFSALMDVIVAGDHEPVALADRPPFQALDSIEDPATYLRSLVAAAFPVLDRLGVIFPTLRAAAASDPEVDAAYRRFVLDARFEDYAGTGRRLGDLGGLRHSVVVAKVPDILWAILSPDTYHLLVDERGWTPEEFEQWAADTLERTLLA